MSAASTHSGPGLVTEADGAIVSVANFPAAATVCGAVPSSTTIPLAGAYAAFEVQVPAQRIVGMRPVTGVPENVTLPATSIVPATGTPSTPPENVALPSTDTRVSGAAETLNRAGHEREVAVHGPRAAHQTDAPRDLAICTDGNGGGPGRCARSTCRTRTAPSRSRSRPA